MLFVTFLVVVVVVVVCCSDALFPSLLFPIYCTLTFVVIPVLLIYLSRSGRADTLIVVDIRCC
jgi:hypothetical protein